MKKSASVDIRNLFQKFGGDTGNYKEIQHDYVSETAQKSWPIVSAIENAHVAAPKLKASARSAPTPGLVSQDRQADVPRAGAAHAMRASSPQVAQSAAFASMFKSADAPATPTPSTSSLFAAASPAPQISQPSPAVAQRPLFAAASPAPQIAQTVPDSVSRSLFGAQIPVRNPPPDQAVSAAFSMIAALNKPASPAAPNVAPVQSLQPQIPHTENLNSVFSRLLNPQNQVIAAQPGNDLRSLFGFLNK